VYIAALVLLSRLGPDYRVPLEPLFIAYVAILLGGKSRSSVSGGT
jgi:hypothetical protein